MNRDVVKLVEHLPAMPKTFTQSPQLMKGREEREKRKEGQ